MARVPVYLARMDNDGTPVMRFLSVKQCKDYLKTSTYKKVKGETCIFVKDGVEYGIFDDDDALDTINKIGLQAYIETIQK